MLCLHFHLSITIRKYFKIYPIKEKRTTGEKKEQTKKDTKAELSAKKGMQ